MSEEYFIWTKGIYKGCLYSVSRKENYTTYTFYTDFKANQVAGEHQLSATLTRPTNVPVSDKDISEVFAQSLSKKICSDIARDSKEYVECMKTLPKGFFTETITDHVLDLIFRQTAKADKETIKKADTACCDFMEYAHAQNHNVRKGTGREHIGE